MVKPSRYRDSIVAKYFADWTKSTLCPHDSPATTPSDTNEPVEPEGDDAGVNVPEDMV
jgi:hypothetical protein